MCISDESIEKQSARLIGGTLEHLRLLQEHLCEVPIGVRDPDMKPGIDMRWREAVKKDALKTPTGGTLTKARELIALFDFGQVAANANAESGIYGCKCGEKKSKGTSYTCCDWGSLRVDLQRPFKLGSTHWASFNVRYAGSSFAAINVQCGVNFDALGENLRECLSTSLDEKVRMWVGNDEGGSKLGSALKGSKLGSKLASWGWQVGVSP